MARNIKAEFDNNGAFRTIYPDQQSCNRGCAVNQHIDTLENEVFDDNGQRVSGYPHQVVAWGPTSLKHIYGPPHREWNDTNLHYPYQKQARPQGTMYDIDTGLFGPFGLRQSYVYRAMYLHNYHPREIRKYSHEVLPMPDIFGMVQHPVVQEGTYGR